MTIITKIPGVTFTDATLPKLYRDSVVTPGTKFCFDAADTYSYAQQANPVAGTDFWRDLTPNNANAGFSTGNTFGSGGFTFNPLAGQTINLPTSGKAPPDASGFLTCVWFKYIAASAQAFSSIAGMCNSTATNFNQYSIDSGAANSGALRLTVLGNTGLAVTPALNSINQIVAGCKKLANGTYDTYFWRNGVLINSVNSGGTSIAPSMTNTNPTIGQVTGFTGGSNFRAFRTFHDDATTLPDVAAMTALVLKDYNANVSRFS